MLGFVRTDNEALVSCLGDSQRAVTAVRKKAGWFTPGGTIYKRTVPRVPRLLRVHVIGN